MPDRFDPHANARVRHAGVPVAEARLVVILLHGRGASAEGILGLSREVRAADVAFLAPQAAGHTWYPQTFLAPIQENEPHLTSALRLVATSIDGLARQGVSAERVALMGFSQGACLALEYVARHARRYAAVAALSGGLIGPPGTPRAYAGSLEGTPVFIGCSDVDSHIPLERVHESTTVLRRLGAVVDERIYPGMGHTISRDELDAVDALLAGG
jgi:predicted esterase